MARVVIPSPGNLDRVAEAIRDGEIVVAPSDTNLGLLLDPRHDDAIEQAYEIKGRDPAKPLTSFVRNPSDWRRFGTHDDPGPVESVVEAFWPGPLNLVLEATDRVAHERLQRGGTVSIGCLSNQVWRSLTARLEGPVAMTSANLSGTMADDELVGVETAVDHVGDDVAYVLDWEPTGTSRASTILSLVDEPTILRQGDITRADLTAETSLF